MPDFIIYDCEIINCIPPKNGQRDPELRYCQGWHDYGNMGISIVGFAYPDGSTGFWDSRKLGTGSLQMALAGETVIGFNSANFDDRLMAANGIKVTTAYDLLLEVRRAGCGSIHWEDQPPGYSYKLDDLAIANGLGGKSGRGDLAPVLWQQGKHQEVIDYCLRDVSLTYQLLKLGWEGKLKDPNTGDYLLLRQLDEPPPTDEEMQAEMDRILRP